MLIRIRHAKARAMHAVSGQLCQLPQEELGPAGREIQAGQMSGSFVGGPAGWSWTRNLEDLGADDDQKEGLFRLTTRVFWAQGERQSMEEAVQMLYVPENRDGVRTLKPKVL